ncbi:MAG: Rpn family recombination-promoting nuclease/putative transposase [Ruminococcus sp.]|uniref:Rpn family recombination-promoting nuclease/putative transposase n=1 Tax=Ruminococcus sp. TaxID=41978 RepID=UPI0025FEE9F5|nr:Rpn family recombination-promoting nuclease/putative transposase [Ruminococcus sp.]MBR0528723.1 Rpn family recombination-promoting nuclease/putative transposase [Ruminococcus sp.]
MGRNNKIVKLKLDIIFKRVFGDARNERIIAAFISDLLEIPRESIKAVTIENVELPPEQIDQKFSRLDLKLNVDDRIVNVEMQVNNEPDFNERTLYYWSKMYCNELNEGEPYGALKQTICINIINFNQFDCADYHSHFKVMESERHEVLSNKFAIHFFELKKIKSSAKKKPMEDWLNLINAETEGDLMDIQNNTKIPEVNDTIVILKRLSADEKVQQEAYYREKRLHDEATALLAAKNEGLKEGREEGLAKGRAEGRAAGREEERAATIKKLREIGISEDKIREVYPDL